MGRRNVADGLARQIEQTAGFDALSTGTVSVHDHRALNTGVDRAAIIDYDRFEQRRLTVGQNEIDWFLDVTLFIRHNNDVVQARIDADVYAQNIVDRVNANSNLGGSAFDAIVVSGEVQDERLVIGQTPWYVETLTVKCTEDAGVA